MGGWDEGVGGMKKWMGWKNRWDEGVGGMKRKRLEKKIEREG